MQLTQDAAHVALDGVDADGEMDGNFFIGRTRSKMAESPRILRLRHRSRWGSRVIRKRGQAFHEGYGRVPNGGGEIHFKAIRRSGTGNALLRFYVVELPSTRFDQ